MLSSIILLNLLLAIGSDKKNDNITLKLLYAYAQPWPEDPPPPGQIGYDVGCEIWVYGCFNCNGGEGWCVIPGVMRKCADQYVCPSCTCTPGPCVPTVSC